MDFQSALCWLRRDLRLHDHSVLSLALEQSREVILVFVFDTQILSRLKHKEDRRVCFIQQSLLELQSEVEGLGSHLIVLHGDPVKELPKLAKSLGVNAVFTGRDYEPYAKKRDQAVSLALKDQGQEFITVKDHVIFEGSEIRTQSDTPFKVFTPFKNAWLKRVRASDIAERKPNLKGLSRRRNLKDFTCKWKLEDLGFKPVDSVITPGTKAAHKSLKGFTDHVSDYKNTRDFPALASTSQLSPHFRFGTISVREAVRLCQKIRTEGSRVWLSELIWRDFYHMILDLFPHVAQSTFKEEYKNLTWPGNPKHFELWKEGLTGFPIIDAAMRHFKKTGWMHNRLRMVVAMFLTKDLLIDYRLGEKYFAENLLDFDLAANNGGWQWSASTGVDAQPYFRIFNPESQSKRFDPDGSFIRQNLPELAKLPDSKIHAPAEAAPLILSEAGITLGRDYPFPIVDHSEQRKKALELFKRLK